jgi:hypothetical protein
MPTVDRRAFLAASVTGLAALGSAGKALAALQCVPASLPSSLVVDCSVGRNVQLFLKNQSQFGLTGVVSMTSVQSQVGSFASGSLFLYPWLKSQNSGPALAAQLSQYQAFLPGPIPANPLPKLGVPLDEEFCTYCLQAPARDFIGFGIDVPRAAHDLHLPWYSMVDQVAGQTVGIDWASSNLNGPWFGGSQAIPAGDDCNGRQWRSLIVAGLRQAATMAC